jgi:Holliday junction DNA helicase RuvA
VIAQLTGAVLRRKAGQLIIDVNGVGYLVSVTPEVYQSSFSQDRLSLHISHIIREDSQTLFGFLTEEELDTFALLCSVSGVGPKSAMAVLAQLGVSGVAAAVAGTDDSMFRSVSGVGPKTAKLIVLSLTGKLVAEESFNKASNAGSSVISALVGLGYQEKQARTAVESVTSSKADLSESEILKQSLNILASGRK